MKSLYYENLQDPQLTQMQRFIPMKLKVFREYLQVTKNHLKDQTLEVEWKPGTQPAQADDAPENGVWVSVKGLEEDLNDTQLKILFEQDGVDALYELPPDQSRSRLNYHNQNRVRILYQDRDSEQLVLDRTPAPGTTLVVQPNTYVVQKQLEAVLQLQDKPAKDHGPLLRLFDRAGKTTWPGFIPSGNSYEWKILTDESRPGTLEQRDFVRKAMDTSDFALLEGPPGSGKTTAICELITQAVQQGQRILLCASTHVAIDNVIERLMVDESVTREIIPVRIGDDGNVSEIVRNYTLKNFRRSEEKRIRNYINQQPEPSDIQMEWSRLIDGKNSDTDELQSIILESANLICGTTIGILQHPEIKENSRKKRSEPAYDMLIIDEASKTTFQEFLVPALQAKKWILVGDPQQLSPYVDADELAANLSRLLSENERDAAFDVFSASLRGRDYRCSIIQASEDSKDELAQLYKSYAEGRELVICDSPEDDIEYADIVILTGEEIAANLHRMPMDVATLRYSDKERLQNQIHAWHKDKKGRHEVAPRWEDQIAWRILSEYDQRLNSGTKSAGNLRTVIDSLIPEKKRADLSRDIEGLSRIAIPSVLECLQKGISRDRNPRGGEFEGSFLTDGFPDYAKAPRYTLLKYQHRMHPHISAFSRSHIYQGAALNDPPYMEAERKLTPPLWYENRSQWLHVGAGFRRGNINPKEAKLIISEIKKLGEWKERTSTKLSSVALLTFYRGQEKHLRTVLRNLTGEKNSFRHFHYKGLTIDLCTVDRFQGHEADVVYLAFVNRRPTYFLQSPNRLNVALTRARYQLVIVGNRRDLAGRDETSLLSKLCYFHLDQTDYPYGENNE
jgi:hypothetical protein